MADVREREASVGRDIASGQFKPKGADSGSLLALMVGPEATEEKYLWALLNRVAPSAGPILQQVMRYADQSV